MCKEEAHPTLYDPGVRFIKQRRNGHAARRPPGIVTGGGAMRYRLLVGVHEECGRSYRASTVFGFRPGDDIVPSKQDLARAYPGKFARVRSAGDELVDELELSLNKNSIMR